MASTRAARSAPLPLDLCRARRESERIGPPEPVMNAHSTVLPPAPDGATAGRTPRRGESRASCSDVEWRQPMTALKPIISRRIGRFGLAFAALIAVAAGATPAAAEHPHNYGYYPYGYPYGYYYAPAPRYYYSPPTYYYAPPPAYYYAPGPSFSLTIPLGSNR